MNDEPRYGQTGTTGPGARGTQGIPPRGSQGRAAGRGTHLPSREEVRETASAAAGEAGRQYDEVKQAAKEKMEAATEEARNYAERHRETVAGMVGAASRALRNSAGQLEDEQEATVARWFRWAADGLEDMAEGLHGHETGDLWHGVQDYARRQPGMAFGGAMAAGFALSRLLKSHEEPIGYEGGAGYGGEGSRLAEEEAREEPFTGPQTEDVATVTSASVYETRGPGDLSSASGEGAPTTATAGPTLAGGQPPLAPEDDLRGGRPDPFEPVKLRDEPGKEER